MVIADFIIARRGGGLGRLISYAIEGDPIALTIIGVIAFAVVFFITVRIYGALKTPSVTAADEELSAEEKAMMDKFDT